MCVDRAVEFEAVTVVTVPTSAAQTVSINGRAFVITNVGSNPLHIKPDGVVTSATGLTIPANTTYPVKMTVSPSLNSGNLSLIASTGATTANIAFFDM